MGMYCRNVLLPDDYLLCSRAVELVACFYVESFEEGDDVAQGNVYAVFRQRVYVADGEVAFFFVTAVGSPDVGIVQVESLFGGVTVDFCIF